MTLAQHRELGEKLQEFRNLLMQDGLNIRPKSYPVSKSILAALKSIERMQSELDSVVCQDFPDCKDATQIYYQPGEPKG